MKFLIENKANAADAMPPRADQWWGGDESNDYAWVNMVMLLCFAIYVS